MSHLASVVRQLVERPPFLSLMPTCPEQHLRVNDGKTDGWNMYRVQWIIAGLSSVCVSQHALCPSCLTERQLDGDIHDYPGISTCKARRHSYFFPNTYRDVGITRAPLSSDKCARLPFKMKVYLANILHRLRIVYLPSVFCIVSLLCFEDYAGDAYYSLIQASKLIPYIVC